MTRKLHLGGQQKSEGWEVLNALPADYVDHVCNANNLEQFEDNTFEEIYGSHIVEHLDYKEELLSTLKEWLRVMKPGGKAYISVPDLDILCQIFVQRDKLSVEERFQVMRMMFGGHVDEYDYHVVGLSYDILGTFLVDAGFVNIKRVQNFGIFDDTSNLLFKGVPISLNIIAEKAAS